MHKRLSQICSMTHPPKPVFCQWSPAFLSPGNGTLKLTHTRRDPEIHFETTPWCADDTGWMWHAEVPHPSGAGWGGDEGRGRYLHWPPCIWCQWSCLAQWWNQTHSTRHQRSSVEKNLRVSSAHGNRQEEEWVRGWGRGWGGRGGGEKLGRRGERPGRREERLLETLEEDRRQTGRRHLLYTDQMVRFLLLMSIWSSRSPVYISSEFRVPSSESWIFIKINL